MLTQIHICNLATIAELQLEFSSGTTVITGETGAGKSILIDAIELALGARAADNLVRAGKEKADISLCFDIRTLPAAKKWLQSYELDHDGECIIRRTISQDGKSRSYINGMPITLQPLREFSEFLMDIHGQHEHQSLLRADKQRELLDRYANHEKLLNEVHELAHSIQTLSAEIIECQKRSEERATRGEYLKFQLQELQALNLTPNEFATLDLEHKQLAHAGELLENFNHALQCLSESETHNALKLVHQAIHALENIQRVDPKISAWIESLKNAAIYLSDTENELHRYLDSIELDPERLQEIEERISTLFNLARKHKTEPQALYDLQQTFLQEYSELETSDERITELTKKLNNLKAEYLTAAKKLSASRAKAAKKLSADITKTIRELALPHGEFQIYFDTENIAAFSAYGLEKIIFLIQTNLGLPAAPLHKVASGGELSRVSLAIHMATALQYTIPTLIFDEVDVGVGGGTAEIVGKLLRDLGKTHQVFCITHQPQVAALGNHHLRVEKYSEKNATFTRFQFLTAQEKINEIARMLGGVKITEKTLAHAREMVGA